MFHNKRFDRSDKASLGIQFDKLLFTNFGDQARRLRIHITQRRIDQIRVKTQARALAVKPQLKTEEIANVTKGRWLSKGKFGPRNEVPAGAMAIPRSDHHRFTGTATKADCEPEASRPFP